MEMDETTGGNFYSKQSSSNSYFVLFGIVYIVNLTNFANTSLLSSLLSQKFKTEKWPYTEKKKQTSPEKQERIHFRVGIKEIKHLSESFRMTQKPDTTLLIDALWITLCNHFACVVTSDNQ